MTLFTIVSAWFFLARVGSVKMARSDRVDHTHVSKTFTNLATPGFCADSSDSEATARSFMNVNCSGAESRCAYDPACVAFSCTDTYSLSIIYSATGCIQDCHQTSWLLNPSLISRTIANSSGPYWKTASCYVSDTAAVSGILAESTAAGATSLNVTNKEVFPVGSSVTIAGMETKTITATGNVHAGLARSYPSGTVVFLLGGSEAPPSANREVDVFLGTGGHGHTFPGAATPWGMAIATPWAHSPPGQGVDNWDNQAGFISDGPNMLKFYGMAHSGLSGAGSGELGEVRLLPVYETDRWGNADVNLNRTACFASPGYFRGQSVSSAGTTIIESSVTRRAAIHRFSFRGQGKKALKLFLSQVPGNYWGFQLMDHTLKKLPDSSVEGCSLTKDTGIGDAESLLCFAIHVSVPIQEFQDMGSDLLMKFPPNTPSEVIVRVGLSRMDVEHARLNLRRELGQRSLEDVASSAAELWQEALNSVDANIQPTERARVFYTALYHSMLAPQLLSEADGSYRLQRKPQGEPSLQWQHGEIVSLSALDSMMPPQKLPKGESMYHTFSLWDTYRGLHPLINLLHPRISHQFGTSLLRFADAWGYLPRFQLLQSPADMMAGDGGSIILATMARQGLVNASAAFKVLNSTRRLPVDERKYTDTQGFVPASEKNSVSEALEQATADSCVGKLAKDLGHSKEASYFEQKADLAFNYWDAKHKIFKEHEEPTPPPMPTHVPMMPLIDDNMMPRMTEKEETANLQSQTKAYQEGNALQYSFSAFFDTPKMIESYGGNSKFVKALDYFFNDAPEAQGILDLSGNRHSLTIGNEPTMHTPYLYSIAGALGKTQEIVDDVIKRMFKARPDGLPGNDDFGAMSAWIAFSMLGFYPIDPCSSQFVLGRPFISKADLSVSGGKFRIRVHNSDDDNKYFQRVTLNGKDLDLKNPVLSWSELARPGELVMWMTSAKEEQ
eukprot:TRINITY_DN26054_c0_g1_i1.p1 TRINITY_DN26054_c0_g1~~TRINITY_DN26054_c0_g1_i1.p1  ORF type:complete len:954 (-),score=123.45 TRINITY_DN26054_c0_g1_i1:161-3022(-)